MENFSAILQTVWRPAQNNSWGVASPPDRARVKGSVSTAFAVWKYFSGIKKQLILCFDETKIDLKPLIMLF